MAYGIVDMTGRVCGRLTVIKYHSSTHSAGAKWLCQCSCGTTKVVIGKSLRTGKTRSCGCYHKEAAVKNNTTHGMSSTSEYGIWVAIKKRCRDENDSHFENYGARGIDICNEWFSDFSKFFTHVGSKPHPKYELDRIDNSKGYAPGNVRWTTRSVQMRNTRRNRYLTYQGVTLCVADWAAKIGMSRRCLYNRLNKGWSTEAVLTTPLRGVLSCPLKKWKK